MTDTTYRDFARALRNVLEQPALEQKLKRGETAAAAADELRLDDDMRRELLNLLQNLHDHGLGEGQAAARVLLPTALATWSPAQLNEVDRARNFMDESFKQLRSAYSTSMWMSRTVFAIGIGFLLLAAVQTIRGAADAATVSVIGGVGVAQIVALFYRNPLADIAHAVTNAQQTRIAITSYLMGVSLIGEQVELGRVPTEAHLMMLLDLSERTQTWLGNRAKESPGAGSEQAD